MRLERQTIFAVEGIASLPAATVPIVTRMRMHLPAVGVEGPTPAVISAFLTTNVDEHSHFSDQRIAIANLILKGGIGQVQDARAIKRELKAVRELRSHSYARRVFLITEVSRSTREPRREGALAAINTDAFDLVFEGPRSSAILEFRRQTHEAEMALMGAVRLTANDPLQHHEVQSATYLLNSERHPEYWMWLEAGSVEARVSANITASSAREMRKHAKAALRKPEASRSLSLVGRASSIGEDPTVEFLVSFTALEHYVKGQVARGTLRTRFARLAHDRRPAGERANDAAEFDALYKARNVLAHEGALIDNRGLARRIRQLLGRYIT